MKGFNKSAWKSNKIRQITNVAMKVDWLYRSKKNWKAKKWRGCTHHHPSLHSLRQKGRGNKMRKLLSATLRIVQTTGEFGRANARRDPNKLKNKNQRRDWRTKELYPKSEKGVWSST
jgi:hypothetical protein